MTTRWRQAGDAGLGSAVGSSEPRGAVGAALARSTTFGLRSRARHRRYPARLCRITPAGIPSGGPRKCLAGGSVDQPADVTRFLIMSSEEAIVADYLVPDKSS